MIPLKRFTVPGCPYHGLVVDGVLTLPNNSTMAWPNTVTAESQALRNPVGAAKAQTRTPAQLAADVAAGRQWLDYELRNGQYLNTTQLSLSTLYREWILYCDPAGNVWWIVNQWIPSGSLVRPRLHLRGLFGRSRVGLTPADYNLDIELFAADYTPTDNESITQSFYSHSILQNESGNKALLRIYRTIRGASAAQQFLWTQYSIFDDDAGTRLSDLYELTISGTGSTDPATLGDGISITASLVADYSTLFSDQSVNSTNISEADIQGRCAGPFGSQAFQVTVGGAAQGPTFGGQNESTDAFTAKLDAHYDHLGAIRYVERSYSDSRTYTASAEASATLESPDPTTWRYLFSGTSTTAEGLSASVTTGFAALTGEWTRTRVLEGSYDGTSTGATPCTLPPIVDLSLVSDTETGAPESAEVYVSAVTRHGLIVVAQGYDDNGTTRYTRTVLAPDGNTLAISPVDAPITRAKMLATGLAWHPVTGQIVYYPGQQVGFV